VKYDSEQEKRLGKISHNLLREKLCTVCNADSCQTLKCRLKTSELEEIKDILKAPVNKKQVLLVSTATNLSVRFSISTLYTHNMTDITSNFWDLKFVT